jgi:hypothetical protein
LFRRSYQLDPAVGTLLNLAICEEELGHLTHAWQQYQRVIETLPADDDRLPIAEQRMARLAERLPRLVIRIANGAPAATRVYRDGSEVSGASLGAVLIIDPGDHVITAEAEGHKPRRYRLSVDRASTHELTVEPGPEISALVEPPSAHSSSELPQRAPAQNDARAQSGSSQRTWGYVVGGLGAASFVVTGVVSLLILERKADISSDCNHSNFCGPTGLEAARQIPTLSAIGTTAFALGIVGLGAGAYLVLDAPSDPPQSGATNAWKLTISGRF